MCLMRLSAAIHYSYSNQGKTFLKRVGNSLNSDNKIQFTSHQLHCFQDLGVRCDSNKLVLKSPRHHKLQYVSHCHGKITNLCKSFIIRYHLWHVPLQSWYHQLLLIWTISPVLWFSWDSLDQETQCLTRCIFIWHHYRRTNMQTYLKMPFHIITRTRIEFNPQFERKTYSKKSEKWKPMRILNRSCGLKVQLSIRFEKHYCLYIVTISKFYCQCGKGVCWNKLPILNFTLLVLRKCQQNNGLCDWNTNVKC